MLAWLPACLSLQSDEQKAEAAEKAVLARHDELMAQMDQLTVLRQQLQKTPGLDTVAAGRQRRALLAADAAMMDWMHRYRKPADTVTVARRLQYFSAQQHTMDSVATLFRTSQDSARLLLKAANATATTSPRS
jgi:predicted house-cleaning NTP pyrophosphatase (Maf/HAM1 superfamily)